MKNSNNNNNNNTSIVYFHIGRGGRFHNQGHKTFEGIKDIQSVLNSCDNAGQNTFFTKENYQDIYRSLEEKGATNLIELLQKCQDNNDYTEFETKTGLSLGEDVYTDCNGSVMITEEELQSGVGTLEWDGDYDTDICCRLADCDENELRLIANDDHHGDELMIEYFDNLNLKIDWSIFNGNYEGLIELLNSADLDSSYDFSDFYVTIESED